MKVRWDLQSPPLVPVAVGAFAEVATQLADRLLALDAEHLGRLRGVQNEQALVILGEADDLPWVDGVTYLGRRDDAPELLLPTHRAPNVPAGLIARRFSHLGKAALFVNPSCVVRVSQAGPIDRETLAAWRSGR